MGRPLLFQPIVSTVVNVGIAPTPLVATGNINQLVASFAISVPTGGNNVFLGDSNVTASAAGVAGSGLELVAGGGAVLFELKDIRMMYELMYPILKMADILGCQKEFQYDVPLAIWDLSQVFVIAAVAQTISLATFKIQFV